MDKPLEVPFGYCHCGCGQKTKLAIKTDRHKGHVLGLPHKYLPGHRVRRHGPVEIQETAQGILIPLTQGAFALVDPDDVDRILERRWQLHAVSRSYTDYATSSHPFNILMHRFIMNAPHGLVVDHINGNGLNNTKGNLRLVTQSENNSNRHRARESSPTGAPGVFWDKTRHQYAVRLQIKGKIHNLGRFKSLEAAVAIRRKAELDLLGYNPLPLPNDRSLKSKQRDLLGTNRPLSKTITQ